MKVVAVSNTENAIRSLYYILVDRYHLSEDDIELHISHTSSIALNPEVFESPLTLPKIESYCKGFVDGIDEAINQALH